MPNSPIAQLPIQLLNSPITQLLNSPLVKFIARGGRHRRSDCYRTTRPGIPRRAASGEFAPSARSRRQGSRNSSQSATSVQKGPKPHDATPISPMGIVTSIHASDGSRCADCSAAISAKTPSAQKPGSDHATIHQCRLRRRLASAGESCASRTIGG